MLATLFQKIVGSALRFLMSLILFVKTTFGTDKSSLEGDNVLTLSENRFPSQREQMYIFAKNFFKDPRMVGSIIPSSRFLIDKLLSPVDWDKARLFVEYGPGIGNISIAILKRMHPDAKLVLIELNEDMAEYLNTSFRDPRVINVQGSATDVGQFLSDRQLGKADYIVSGIPFSMLPPGVGEAVVDATYHALRPGGQFLIYQYRRKVLELLRPRFDKIDIDFVTINVPPAQVFFAHR